MHIVLYDWPYFGLVAGIVALASLLLVPWPTPCGSRWRDPSWLVCLILPVYMLHQFEEHGINLLGQRYQFIVDLCRTLGYQPPPDCPATPEFVLAVNCGGGVWIPATLAILWHRRNVMVGACALGVPLVNAVVHIAQAAAFARYNSGLLTAVVLFLPFCFWTLAQLSRAGVLTGGRLAAIVASGVLLHVALAGSLLGHAHGLWGEGLVLGVNVIDFLIPFGFAFVSPVPASALRAS